MVTPRVLVFDVFGTMVDWRGSIIREARSFAAAHGFDLLRTTFVRRPKELGRPSGYDLPHERSFDFIANDLKHRASQLGT